MIATQLIRKVFRLGMSARLGIAYDRGHMIDHIIDHMVYHMVWDLAHEVAYGMVDGMMG